MAVTKEFKDAFSAACRKAADACGDALYLEEAWIGDDCTHVALNIVDAYYTNAETFFDFYCDGVAEMEEVVAFFAQKAKGGALSEGDVVYFGTFDEEKGEAEGVSQGDFEQFCYFFEDAIERFAAALAACSLPDGGGGWLVVAGGVRWDGASGYMVVDDQADALSRSYDANFRFVSLDAEVGVARLVESSHDAPMGASVSVIALTPGERDRIDAMDVAEVLEWADAKIGG